MQLISKLLNLIEQAGLLRGLLIAAVCWLVVAFFCCALGAVALYGTGRKKGLKPYLPAFLPGGQIWYTLKLAGRNRSARTAEHLMWWCPALVVCGGAAIMWSAYFYVLDIWGGFFGLVIPGILILLAALILYVCVRVMELKCLWKMLKGWQWALSLVGTLLFLPIQRILLFAAYKKRV